MSKHNSLVYDIFFGCSLRDTGTVRKIAERLRDDGVRVWFSEWEIKLGDDSLEKYEIGLESSRMFVLCFSGESFGSVWGKLEAGTLQFRDPLNKERSFIPMRLDDSPVPDALSQFQTLDWSKNSEKSYAWLLDACRAASKAKSVGNDSFRKTFTRGRFGRIREYTFLGNGEFALLSCGDGKLRMTDTRNNRSLIVFSGHKKAIRFSNKIEELGVLFSCSEDNAIIVWKINDKNPVFCLNGHNSTVYYGDYNPRINILASCSHDKTIRLWDLSNGNCTRVIEGHAGGIGSVVWSPDRRFLLSSSEDKTLKIWNYENGDCIKTFNGHVGGVWRAAWSPDGLFVVSAGVGSDLTVRVWDTRTGNCVRVLEGHTGELSSVVWHPNQRFILSASQDQTVKVWDWMAGDCMATFAHQPGGIQAAAWISQGAQAIFGDEFGNVRTWDVSEFLETKIIRSSVINNNERAQYTNAKVLLVGESSSGKTGLSKRLALDHWEPSDSTIGAWATQWKLPVNSDDGIEREVWLWDFGGQADQRLIHQLYMDETALAVLVFDGQKADLFDTLGQWDRDLSRASSRDFAKLLVAGRIDASSVGVSRAQIESFINERSYSYFLETSAKTGQGCEELKQAILKSIDWHTIPWRSSPKLFKRLKEEIILLKDNGYVLVRFNDLREILRLRLITKMEKFEDAELKAVVRLLTGPGIVWELGFGSWVLLQPEQINVYAQAVIRTMRNDDHERGCLAEERVLNGDLSYGSIARLGTEDERIVLLAMVETVVKRGLCLREHTEHGTMLIFPSYYRRERPDLVGHPAVLISYQCNGFLDDIYATLVVKLHHTAIVERDALWRYAADFRTQMGKQLGVKLTRRAEGAGELAVYFDPTIDMDTKITFAKFVHEHLKRTAKDVVRLRHYVCPYCGTPVGNREVAMRKLEEGKKDVPCLDCEKRVPLWDEMESLFGSDRIRAAVIEMEKRSSIVLDNESKERVLVGEVISTVAHAGHLSRELTVSDHGIDMEVEFKDNDGEATGKKLYLQLKSGQSHLRIRKGDGAEIFDIKDERHARYWMMQAFPVFLVIRDNEGNVRWMEVSDWLRNESQNGKKSVRRIVFNGEKFDVMSVLRWKEKVSSGREVTV